MYVCMYVTLIHPPHPSVQNRKIFWPSSVCSFCYFLHDITAGHIIISSYQKKYIFSPYSLLFPSYRKVAPRAVGERGVVLGGSFYWGF